MNRRKDQRRGWIHGNVRDLGDASEFLHAFSRLTLISHANTINSRPAPCFIMVISHIRWLLLCSHHNILRFFCAAPSFVDCFFPIALLRKPLFFIRGGFHSGARRYSRSDWDLLRASTAAQSGVLNQSSPRLPKESPLRDRRSHIWAHENHDLRQEASRAVNYSTLSPFWAPDGARTRRVTVVPRATDDPPHS